MIIFLKFFFYLFSVCFIYNLYFLLKLEVVLLKIKSESGEKSFGKAAFISGKKFVNHLKCKFGYIGITKAFYVDSETIKCYTPAKIPYQNNKGFKVTLEISLNGENFYDTSKIISFSYNFVKVSSNSYIWYIIGCIILIIVIIIFVYVAVRHTRKSEEENAAFELNEME